MRQSQLFKLLWPLSNKFSFSRFTFSVWFGGRGWRRKWLDFLELFSSLERSNQGSFLSTVSWTLVDGLFVKHFGSFVTRSKKGKSNECYRLIQERHFHWVFLLKKRHFYWIYFSYFLKGSSMVCLDFAVQGIHEWFPYGNSLFSFLHMDCGL